ncbi:hypothetical protein [Thermococcus sp.]|uniref:hypothetical protein n=1 Tax=Thermococcus sp. TaxID=35749 RepID=UPI002624793E|nr:hypothetical protein [Thermococcus sp.]
MRSKTKRRIIPLALALVLAIVGAALAVPVIKVTVQEIGAGSNTITTPIGTVSVDWNLNKNNPDILNNISVTVNTNPGAGALYVKFYDNGKLGYIATINFSKITSKTTILIGNSSADVQLVNVTSGATVPFPIDVQKFNATEVKVVYVGPRQ